MQKEVLIQENIQAVRLDIVEKTLIQLQSIIEDLPENSLDDPARLVNARSCTETALRSLRLFRECSPFFCIVD